MEIPSSIESTKRGESLVVVVDYALQLLSFLVCQLRVFEDLSEVVQYVSIFIHRFAVMVLPIFVSCMRKRLSDS